MGHRVIAFLFKANQFYNPKSACLYDLYFSKPRMIAEIDDKKKRSSLFGLNDWTDPFALLGIIFRV